MPCLLQCPFYGKVAVLIQLHDLIGKVAVLISLHNLIGTVVLKLSLQHHRGKFIWLLMSPLLILDCTSMTF